MTLRRNIWRGGCQTVVEFLASEHALYTPIKELVSNLKNKWDNTPLHSAAMKNWSMPKWPFITAL